MNLAARVRKFREQTRPPNPIKLGLVEKLRKLNETGKTVIDGKTFSLDNIRELTKLLAIISIRQPLVALVTPRENGKIDFVVSDCADRFFVGLGDQQIGVNTLVSSENSGEIETTCTMIGFSSKTLKSMPISTNVFCESIENEVRNMPNPLIANVIASFGFEKAFDATVCEYVLGEYAYAKLVGLVTRPDDWIKKSIAAAYSPYPQISFLKMLETLDNETIAMILQMEGIRSVEEVVTIDRIKLNVIAGNLTVAILNRSSCEIQDVLNIVEAAQIINGVFGQIVCVPS
ncbi:MAG: hypothetical protein Q7S22_04015 [Candidatus Micrarchaeota archaeon]|nr:hypothetical protein [Candidatus Micrarchaeota archaeon]